MSASNARGADVNQDPPDQEADTGLNLKKLARVMSRVASPYDPEALTAARLADRMVRDANMSWDDFFDSAHQKDIAVEAAVVLQAELNELRARVAEYERSGGGGRTVAVWQDVRAAAAPRRNGLAGSSPSTQRKESI